MDEAWYSVEQVADLLGLHVKTVRNHIREARLRAVRIGKHYRIARDDLEAFTGRPVAEREPVRRHRRVEVTSVVQIDAIGKEEMERLGTYVVASLNTRSGGPHVHVQTAYDEERASMKIIVTGDIEPGAEVLRLVGALLEAGS